MTIKDIEFEMNINDVEQSDIAAILETCKTSGFSAEHLDEELQKRGYPKIFDVNYDDMVEIDEDKWNDFD